jgi:hypothetical protein
MKIDGKEYEFIFGFSAYRKLQKVWECKNMTEVLSIFNSMGDNPDIEKVLDIVKAGLCKHDLKEEDIIDYLDSYGPNLNVLINDILKEALGQLTDGTVSKKKTQKKKNQ